MIVFSKPIRGNGFHLFYFISFHFVSFPFLSFPFLSFCFASLCFILFSQMKENRAEKYPRGTRENQWPQLRIRTRVA